VDLHSASTAVYADDRRTSKPGTIASRRRSAGTLDAALALNEAVVPAVNSLDPDRMRWFFKAADYCRVVGRDDEVLAS
jgi:predicted GNAT superfamily acetyltransferase